MLTPYPTLVGRYLKARYLGTPLTANFKVTERCNLSCPMCGIPRFGDRQREMTVPQIRNVATVGGNLCQRNRCWYFRDEHVHCLLKDGDKCYALDGENRYHAVFTKGHKCVIVSPSTLAPVLIALDAVVEVLGPGGGKNVAVGRFFKAPIEPR